MSIAFGQHLEEVKSIATNLDVAFLGIGYTDWSVLRTIWEAENISRWNPWICHEWMEEAANRLDIVFAPYYKEYNKAVHKINAQWKRNTKYRWYNEKEFWKKSEWKSMSNNLSRIDERANRVLSEFQENIKLIRELDDRTDIPKIIIRPHPSDDLLDWRKLSKSFK